MVSALLIAAGLSLSYSPGGDTRDRPMLQSAQGGGPAARGRDSVTPLPSPEFVGQAVAHTPGDRPETSPDRIATDVSPVAGTPVKDVGELDAGASSAIAWSDSSHGKDSVEEEVGGRPTEASARIVGGEAQPYEISYLGGNDVIHISNVGDRIIMSREPSDGSSGGILQVGGPEPASGAGAADGVADTDEADAPAATRPDYEDVYPGCPRVLPQGADEVMAAERLQLYGCLYYAVCDFLAEGGTSSCTWYLNQKIH